jgi:hypothetical protein
VPGGGHRGQGAAPCGLCPPAARWWVARAVPRAPSGAWPGPGAPRQGAVSHDASCRRPPGFGGCPFRLVAACRCVVGCSRRSSRPFGRAAGSRCAPSGARGTARSATMCLAAATGVKGAAPCGLCPPCGPVVGCPRSSPRPFGRVVGPEVCPVRGAGNCALGHDAPGGGHRGPVAAPVRAPGTPQARPRCDTFRSPGANHKWIDWSSVQGGRSPRTGRPPTTGAGRHSPRPAPGRARLPGAVSRRWSCARRACR